MSWAMNLKGHKVFQFGRLRELKSLGEGVQQHWFSFSSYMEVNIFTC